MGGVLQQGTMIVDDLTAMDDHPGLNGAQMGGKKASAAKKTAAKKTVAAKKPAAKKTAVAKKPAASNKK